MNKQKFNPMTEILAGDLENIGKYNEAALAGVVKDFLMTSPVVFGLNVRANATPDLSVFVDCGRLYQNGLQGEQDEPSQPQSIAAPPASGSRIDRICAQYSAIEDLPQTRNAITDVTTRNTKQEVVKTRTHGAITYQVVSGQAAPDHPVPPAIPEGYISLAQVLVSAGINNVQQSAIFDERPTLKSLLSHTHSGGNDGAAIDYNKLNNLPDLTKLLSNLSWRAKRSYNVGDVCCPSAIGSNKLAECVAAGTTAVSEPTWPVVGQTIVDGSVTWRVCDCRQATAQFDNSGRLATTAWIGARGVQYAGTTVISTGPAMLDVSHAGKLIDLPNTYSGNLTLPSSASFSDGATITIWSGALNTISVQRAGSDVIWMSNLIVTSFNMSNGDTVTLMKTGAIGVQGGWIVVGGSAQLAFSGVFAGLLSGAGYKKIPGGLILQWTTTSGSVAASGSGSAGFPCPFPNACLFAIAVPIGISSNNNAGNVVCGETSVNGVNLYNWGPIAAPARVLAIGL